MDPVDDTPRILTILQTGELELQGQFVHGSNYTFLARVTLDGAEVQAVYKPVRGEQPLWDFPVRSLAKREAAAFVVSRALGFDLVPPTVYRRKAELGPGSLQLFIPHDPNEHYFNLPEAEHARLMPVVVFDLLLNNADRKGGHILRDATGRLWLIDHGLCFHVEDKLRTVIWEFAGQPVPEEWLAAVRQFLLALEAEESPLEKELLRLLRRGEVRSLAARALRLLENPIFPAPTAGRRMVPWPPL